MLGTGEGYHAAVLGELHHTDTVGGAVDEVDIVCANADNDSSYADASSGSRLAFKSRELAIYAGKTFTREYADFVFPERQNPLGNESD